MRILQQVVGAVFSVGTTPTLTSGFTAPDGSSNAYKISNPNKDSLWGYDGVADTNYARNYLRKNSKWNRNNQFTI